MSKSIKMFLTVCLFTLALPLVHAEKVYRSVDGQGVVEFSDQANQDSKEITVQEAPTYKAVKPKPLSLPASQVKPNTPAPPTAQIEIVSPTQKETIRSNPGDLTVVVSLPGSTAKTNEAPVLKAGQKIRLVMDGKVISEGIETTIQLKYIDRGTHQLKAELVDSSGAKLAESASVEFYMKRFSKLFKKPVNPVKTK